MLVNGFSPSVADSWGRWIHRMTDSLGLRSVIIDKDVPVGNMPSYLHMKHQALSLKESERTIVFFLEDDYLLLPTAIMEMVEVRAPRGIWKKRRKGACHAIIVTNGRDHAVFGARRYLYRTTLVLSSPMIVACCIALQRTPRTMDSSRKCPSSRAHCLRSILLVKS